MEWPRRVSGDDAPDFPRAGHPAATTAEAQLLLRLAQGDDSAFWSVWLAHRDFLFQLCRRQMEGRRADAEDALARVQQKALAGLPRVAATITNLKGWLGRVAANVCRDIHRENQCRRCGARMDDALLEEDEALASSDADPGNALLLRELEERLQRAIAALPSGLREAAELFFLQDCTPEEVAHALAITVANAHKRIQRARALLKEAVQAYFSGADMSGPRRRHAPGAWLSPTAAPPNPEAHAYEHCHPEARQGFSLSSGETAGVRAKLPSK